MPEMSYIEAIRLALGEVLRDDPATLLYGEDVADFGGAFKATLGLVDEFGPTRVFDTPICESAMLGVAIGMATQGLRPIVELQFADFVTTALHQLLNNAGTFHYRTGVAVPLVVRAPCGGGFSGGPFHSEELETFFCHMPGIKVVYPAFPSDARNLLHAAVRDPNPVIFLENKFLYRRIKEEVSATPEVIPLGKARICRNGSDATVITYGGMVPECLRAARRLAADHGYEVTVVDLRSLKPYDKETVMAAVAATGRVLIVHEGWHTCGFGAELAAFIAENVLHLLDAPIRRLTAPDSPVPFSPVLEERYRPNAARVADALLDLIRY